MDGKYEALLKYDDAVKRCACNGLRLPTARDAAKWATEYGAAVDETAFPRIVPFNGAQHFAFA